MFTAIKKNLELGEKLSKFSESQPLIKFVMASRLDAHHNVIICIISSRFKIVIELAPIKPEHPTL